MSMKKAFKQGMITLSEYQQYLHKQLAETSAEYEQVKQLKTYWCITYTKYNDGRIIQAHISDIENTNEKPINSVQEREDYAVYHEWYSDFKYANIYLDQLQGVINQYDQERLYSRYYSAD